MSSLVPRESLLRKLRFPRIVIPIAATLTAAITFLINLLVVAGFVAWNGDRPAARLAADPPAAPRALPLHSRHRVDPRDALRRAPRHRSGLGARRSSSSSMRSPIIYPIGYLPPLARKLAFLNPFTQVLQDIRALVLYHDLRRTRSPPRDVRSASLAR